MKNIIGGGKTFAGAAILIVGGIAEAMGALPAGVTLGMTPLAAISAGLVSIGLGAKLEGLLALLGGK